MATQKKSTKTATAVRPSKVTRILSADGTATRVKPQARLEPKADGRVRIPAETIDFIRINARQLGGDMSQPQLARAVGCSQPTISYIISGKIRNS